MKEGFRKRVGRYYLGRTLGEGTYAKVKYAQHIDTGEPVAIKVLEKSQLIKGQMVEQIQREITIMRHLNHPNIVNLIEVMSSKDKIYIVMELITGGELFDKIAAEGPLKEATARLIFRQLLDGLEYCHQQGVYHRDVKPENVLLTADGTAKLSDFGLGALQQHTRVDGLFMTTCGTPNYVAPEVLRRRGYEGGPADLWSLGVVLYVMLAGCLPFEEPDLATLFRKICAADYPEPPWFTEPEKRLLRKLIEPDADKRAGFAELRQDPWVAAGGFAPPPLPRTPSADSLIGAGEDILAENVALCELSREEAEAAKKLARPPATRKRLNAFELINRELDISALFTAASEEPVQHRTRFSSRADHEAVVAALEAAAVARGGRCERRDKDTLRLRLSDKQKRPLVVEVHVADVLPGLRVVECSKYSGQSVAFYAYYKWLTESALADIITRRDEGAQVNG